MTNNRPLVSVLMPVYNEERFIGRAIKSILSQSYRNIEIIISDNSSLDETLEICESFKKIDNRIKIFVQEKNIGMINNEVFLTKKINGDFFMWAPADDFWDKNFIRSGVYFMLENKQAISCFGKSFYFINNFEIFKNLNEPIYLSDEKYKRIKSFLSYQINDILLYGIHRSNIESNFPPSKKIFSPEILQIYNILIAGKYYGVPNMIFYKYYDNKNKLSRNKTEQQKIYRLNESFFNRHGVYFYIIIDIFKHFNLYRSIKLILNLFFYRIKFFRYLFQHKINKLPSEY